MDNTRGMADARIYTDFNGLQQLKSRLGGQPSQSREATKEVAKQFESLFLQMMLKSMREATDSIRTDGDSMESEQTRFYQEMFDKQVALDLASRENGAGLGIAALLERDLANNQAQELQARPVAEDYQMLRKQIELIHSNLETDQD